MKIRFIPIVILVAGLLAGCSASATPTQPPPEDVILEPTVTSQASVPTQDASSLPTSNPTQTLPSTALPIATSRGPELETTDPTTVTLATGGLQFIEFFEFW